MNPRIPFRRYHVVVRPKLRVRRFRQQAAVAAVAALGLGAAVTLRHLRGDLPPWRSVLARLSPRVSRIEVGGLSEPLRAEAASFLDSQGEPASPGERAEALKRRFACVRDIRLRREWLSRRVRLELELHKPVGRVLAQGRLSGYLSGEGIVFGASQGLCERALGVGAASGSEPSLASSGKALTPGAGLPGLEVRGADAAELKSLAGYLAAVSGSPEALSPLSGMRFISPQDGWEARFADGTTVLWGSLSFTPEKLARLREVMEDARGRFQGALAADLRYFEDGKILIKPAQAPAAPSRGGT